ncbi:MAG: thiamine pyrophosphate-dependent enzyme [Candidatus Aminicenantes bacterium]|nr:thiamine pyrophosphate-dependent enzyme [Candidatus Aminicenantes bacterium]MDH5386019.1 thiamine pyrophosphate-dependent enzyme [Candidatus Aminicenantes bacterium]MDH5743752.1 thiamine pyrophosphate-dependent enzyme [Candidatus Aminicenantes bacterium]
MTLKTLNGDQAMAFGALSSGVKIVTSYPGSPSLGTVETLINLADKHNIYVEWSSNEKVALEMGIGASIAGRRVLVCTKSVGLNLMIDPLMALNLTPVNGGLVILLGDDPGGYGSQNDQDSRVLVAALEMPMMEPASPAEGYAMMCEAYNMSERFNTAVIIRVTRSFTQQVESVPVSDRPYRESNLGLVREPWRFVPIPKNAVEKHKALHKTIEAVCDWADTTSFNKATGKGIKGIIGAGFAHRKLLDVIGDKHPGKFRLLQLGILYPLPRKIITKFLLDCREVLIVEETEPFLETQIKAIAHDMDCPTKIFGKQSRHLSREGELFRWQIQDALAEFIPEFVPMQPFLKEKEAEEKPKKEDYCAECYYDRILDKLGEAAESQRKKPVLIGDPGCLVTVADRLDAKYALGSAVSVADGLSKAGIEERAVALFGDSSFFHTTLPAICNAVHNNSKILMVVLDNKATASTGFQVNPGVGRDARGLEAPALDIEQIARACGVKKVYTCGPDEIDSTLKDTFRQALSHHDLTLVVVRMENHS